MKKLILLIIVFCSLFFNDFSFAQTIDIDADNLVPKVTLSLSPSSGSFVQESTFEVPILIDTKEQSVNGVEIKIKFDPNKLSIVKPSGGTSIIGVWVEPPVFNNTLGTASYVGVIPGGIKTSSGLVGVITFKAKSTGKASVYIDSGSKVLLNDGLGSEARVNLGRSDYFIVSKPPIGVNIFSETHPVEGDWSKNNNPILSWEKEGGVSGFSYVLDNQPNTIPDNTVDTEDTTIQFQDLDDGVWYFHIKSNKNGIWGQTGSYVIKIDTNPPAIFEPEVNYLLASSIVVERVLVSFFTTDNLSGINRYEVGIIDKTEPLTVSPVFVESESPFQVPIKTGSKLHVIVRAFDNAGNIREVGIDINPPKVMDFVQKYWLYFLGFLLVCIILLYLYSRRKSINNIN